MLIANMRFWIHVFLVAHLVAIVTAVGKTRAAVVIERRPKPIDLNDDISDSRSLIQSLVVEDIAQAPSWITDVRLSLYGWENRFQSL